MVFAKDVAIHDLIYFQHKKNTQEQKHIRKQIANTSIPYQSVHKEQ